MPPELEHQNTEEIGRWLREWADKQWELDAARRGVELVWCDVCQRKRATSHQCLKISQGQSMVKKGVPVVHESVVSTHDRRPGFSVRHRDTLDIPAATRKIQQVTKQQMVITPADGGPTVEEEELPQGPVEVGRRITRDGAEEPMTSRPRTDIAGMTALFPANAYAASREDGPRAGRQVLIQVPSHLEQRLRDCNWCRARGAALLDTLADEVFRGPSEEKPASPVEPCAPISTA